MAGGEAEKEGGNAEKDGHRAEPAGAEKVAQYAKGSADGTGRDARASPEEGGHDAEGPAEEAEDAGDPARKKHHLLLATCSPLLARSPEVLARSPAVPAIGQDLLRRVCTVDPRKACPVRVLV